MATQRIAYNPSTFLGNKWLQLASLVQATRQLAGELNLIHAKYNSDFAAMANDSGASSGDCTTLTNQIAIIDGELSGTVPTQINAGQQTTTRQFADAVGR